VKKEILKLAEENGVESAAKKFGVTETSIYEWRRAGKRRGQIRVTLRRADGTTREEDSAEVRDRQVLAMWRQHPGYAQARYGISSSAEGSGSRWERCGT